MSENKSAVVLSFLVGGIIGAGLALLYAPAPGVETRRRLKEGIDAAKTGLDEGVGKVKALAVEKTEDVKAAYASGKEAFLKGRDRLLKEV
ncbi:MAG: YtxH domain-containing protein [Deltaproteobacteria bacterium]|nr:YtxH domain-containing protein [Deltaproteobacteria bacterium]